MVTFTILGILILASAIAAMTLRNLVHCALALILSFGGLAAIYLQLGAQFVAFAQVLIYIGAVAILIVFAILLTQGGELPRQATFSGSWPLGVAVAVAAFLVLSGVLLSSRAVTPALPVPPPATVHQIGDQLMTRYVLPLEVVGLLLTAALIGAVLIALRERNPE